MDKVIKGLHISGEDLNPLKEFTAARIAIGRRGVSIPTSRSLEFNLAHAHARDAVYSKLDVAGLTGQLKAFGISVLRLHSKAEYREQYLQRPDYGRALNSLSAEELTTYAGDNDVAMVVADGLSAEAVNENTVPLLNVLIPLLTSVKIKIAPVCLVEQGRVAIGDEIGGLLKAKLIVMLIGERPGLSAADSMGAYITYNPQPGLTDEARNCISNIRPQGLTHKPAAEKIFYIISEAFKRKLSGVGLKDNAGSLDQ